MTTQYSKNVTTIAESTITIFSDFIKGSFSKKPDLAEKLINNFLKSSFKEKIFETVKTNQPEPKVKVVQTRVSPPKDPNAPTKAPTAYLLFRSKRIEQLKDEHEDFKYNDYKDQITEEWNKIKNTPKAVEWEKLHQEKKEEYERLKEEYEGSEEWKAHQVVLEDFKDNPEKYAKKGRKKRGSNKKAVDPTKPHRPLSAYFRWQKDAREEHYEKFKNDHTDLSSKQMVSEFSKFLSDIWNNQMSEQDKKKYVDAYQKEAADYEKKIANWRPSAEFAKEHPEIAEKENNLADKRQNKTSDGKPKRAKTAYSYFQSQKNKELAAEIPDGKDRRSKISELWKTEFKSAESRRPWTVKAAKDKLRYNTELVKWAMEQEKTENVEKQIESPPESEHGETSSTAEEEDEEEEDDNLEDIGELEEEDDGEGLFGDE